MGSGETVPGKLKTCMALNVLQQQAIDFLSSTVPQIWLWAGVSASNPNNQEPPILLSLQSQAQDMSSLNSLT